MRNTKKFFQNTVCVEEFLNKCVLSRNNSLNIFAFGSSKLLN